MTHTDEERDKRLEEFLAVYDDEWAFFVASLMERRHLNRTDAWLFTLCMQVSAVRQSIDRSHAHPEYLEDCAECVREQAFRELQQEWMKESTRFLKQQRDDEGEGKEGWQGP